MAVNEEPEERRTPQRLRGRVTTYVNIGLCIIGAVFIVIGVLRSTLLLYVGCAFIGAAIGGFIRSRLPIHQMHMVPPHLHMVYRHELQRNLQSALEDGVQTFLVVNGQRPVGVHQKTIEEHSVKMVYSPAIVASVHKSESVDRISVISSFTESDEPSCIICLLSFKRGQHLRQLRCQHLFHVECIDKWLKINRLCPTCRIDLTGTRPEKLLMESHGSGTVILESVNTTNIERGELPQSASFNIITNTLESMDRIQEGVRIVSSEIEVATENDVAFEDPTPSTSSNIESGPCSRDQSAEVPSSSKHKVEVIATEINNKGSQFDRSRQSSLSSLETCEDCKEPKNSNTPVQSQESKSTVVTLPIEHNAPPWV